MCLHRIAQLRVCLIYNLPVGIKVVIPLNILIFGGYVKVRESLHARVIVSVDTILNHMP